MSIINSLNLKKIKQDIIHLIYPETCIICQNELLFQKKNICLFCQNELQYTYFERFIEPSPLDQLFWGRVKINATYAYVYFEKGKNVQPILHALKYKNKPEIGEKLGVLIGEKIKDLPSFQNIDALIPVPIHPKKKFTRGYNQSEKIADGISSILKIPVIPDFIESLKQTPSQTNKNRFKRWDNVATKFSIKNDIKLNHIAIVDDVITTGATLEAIIKVILENNPEIRISIMSLAITK